MIARILVAMVGAVVITSTLLLGMDAITSIFRERDTARYYRISDVQLRQPGRPDRPEPVPQQPEVPEAGLGLPPGRITIERPTAPDAATGAPARLEAPRLERVPADSIDD